jgi:hypothetical protein
MRKSPIPELIPQTIKTIYFQELEIGWGKGLACDKPHPTPNCLWGRTWGKLSGGGEEAGKLGYNREEPLSCVAAYPPLDYLVGSLVHQPLPAAHCRLQGGVSSRQLAKGFFLANHQGFVVY